MKENDPFDFHTPNPEKITHRIIIYKGTRGEWLSRIKHVNGNVICDSGESYKNRLDCRAALHNLVMALQNRTYEIIDEGRDYDKEAEKNR